MQTASAAGIDLYHKDTIAAISTASGEGGIGIIRMSGKDALKIAKSLFFPKAPKKTFQPRLLHYGGFKDPKSSITIDHGFMVYMRAPASYTGEDVVEFHLHGGPLILKKTLELVLANGARLAGPGEFTKRAFLNSKLDLTEAEAVIDLIRAKSEAALQSARGRLEGRLSKRINGIKQRLADLLMRVEAELDFSEEEVEELPKHEFIPIMEKTGEELKKLISTFEQGFILKEGIKCLILGRPNVGKSSLLNLLLKEEKAIVTPVAGTTRDIIEDTVLIKGIPLRLMDTAGLRDALDHAESIGVERARERIKDAGLILYVVDASERDLKEDMELLDSIMSQREDNRPKLIVVINKTDLVEETALKRIKTIFAHYAIEFISALKQEGIDALEEKIHLLACGRAYGLKEADQGELIASVREKDALIKALSSIERIKTAIKEDMPKELIAIDIRFSIERLGEITGEVTTEDILNGIFSAFCIGK